MHSVAAGIDDNPNAPRTRVCRPCATEVLLWGLREWWICERQKGHLDAAIANRPDCEQGGSCSRQKDLGTLCPILAIPKALDIHSSIAAHARECELPFVVALHN